MAPTPSKSKGQISPTKKADKQKFVTPKRNVFSRLARSCSKSTMKSTEDLVVEEMKKYAFKASPLNRKILERGCISGIPVVKKRPPTTVAPFRFATEERMKLRPRTALSTANSSGKIMTKSSSLKSTSGPLKVLPKSMKATSSSSSLSSSSSIPEKKPKLTGQENEPSVTQK